MLDRILEPEVMDTPADAEEYDRMDHAEVNAQFVDDLLSHAQLRHSFLDLGSGTALIPILLCQRLTNCQVIAVEAAASMIDLARQHLAETGLTDRIRLVPADAKQLPPDLGQFEVVMSNSIIHHLPDPLSALREAVAHTAPGGLLFFRDLLRPSDMATLDNFVKTYAGDASPYARKLFAESLHAALTLEEVRELVGQLGFPPESVEQTSDRHWTWCAIAVGSE
jgi:ubiquinone/menaquinone biosynthesis C-methylase UbiE